MGWLAPRGIVAAATASAFGPALTEAGIPGADKILPICFIAIFGTVALYGLTAAPLARRLRLSGPGNKVNVLVVGGHGWARAVAAALKTAGVPTRLWTWKAAAQAAADEAGIDKIDRLAVDLQAREAQLEDITDVLLLTESDGFNALMAVELHRELGDAHVYRLSAEEMCDQVPAYAEGRTLFGVKGHILFGEHLTFSELTRRFDTGAKVVQILANGNDDDVQLPSDHMTLLFAVSPKGNLNVVTAASVSCPATGDTTIWLASAGVESPA